MQLAKRIRQIPPSATLALNAKANQLKSQGVDIVKFWGGGAWILDTPENIRKRPFGPLKRASPATPRCQGSRSSRRLLSRDLPPTAASPTSP